MEKVTTSVEQQEEMVDGIRNSDSKGPALNTKVDRPIDSFR